MPSKPARGNGVPPKLSLDDKTAVSLGAAVRPVGGRSTVDDVAIEIRRLVLAGTLAPGASFSMADLSEQLQVSHVPVREALRRLEAQGLVTLRPGRGAVVAPISPNDIEDVYRLWILICNDAAARACVRYVEEDFERIADTLAKFTSLPQDSDEAFAGHQRFHFELLMPGMSAWDLRLLEILWLPIERGVRLAFRGIVERSSSEDRVERIHADHLVLLDAARARDVVRLQRELRQHHESHMHRVMTILGEAQPVAAASLEAAGSR